MFSTINYPIDQSFSSCSELSYYSEVEQKVTYELENKLNTKAQQSPVFILIGGLQGSGKSSLIARIREIYDISVISNDVIRQCLLKRGLIVSQEFSKCVSNVYKKLVKASLSDNSNIIIDANTHSERISEVDKLLKENHPHYSTIKIFLNTSEITLRNRVKFRKPTLDCYQGTESDLEAALASTTINLEDYDLIVDTDMLSENNVFELVNNFISFHLN